MGTDYGQLVHLQQTIVENHLRRHLAQTHLRAYDCMTTSVTTYPICTTTSTVTQLLSIESPQNLTSMTA
jgi:hypothetical protein